MKVHNEAESQRIVAALRQVLAELLAAKANLEVPEFALATLLASEVDIFGGLHDGTTIAEWHRGRIRNVLPAPG